MSYSGEYEPVRVAVVADHTRTEAAAPKKTRRAFRPNTFTLTAASPVQRMLPRSLNRCEAWITSAIAASSPPVVFIAGSQAGAAQLGGDCAQINGTDTTPFPVSTTDEVWVSAASASLPCTLSVVAIYEETE